MSERHELEMKAEEIFNMVFAPLGWETRMMMTRRRILWTVR